MSTTRRGRSRRARPTGLAITGLVTVLLGAPGSAASPEPGNTPFESSILPYTLVLPAGWTAQPIPEPADVDVFLGPDSMRGRVGTGTAEPGQTAADRVAVNRADLVQGECVSDPTTDRPTSLGGEDAVAWTWTCPDAFHAAINAVHDGLGYRLSVDVPADQAAPAEAVLEALRSSFVYVAAAPGASPGIDVAVIDAQLQGTWQTEWRPIELELATVIAAGLDASLLDQGYAPTTTMSRWSVRFDAGDLRLFAAEDSGAFGQGWAGSYVVVDSDTIEAIEYDTGNSIFYRFDLHDQLLSIDVIGGETGAGDLVAQTAIYETLPFTRVP